MTRQLFALGLLALFCACEKPSPDRAPHAATLTGSAIRGKTVYLVNCAPCHKEDGKGDPTPTVEGKPLYPSLIERTKALTATEWLHSTVVGKPGSAMLGYASLTDQQLADVYAYAKTL